MGDEGHKRIDKAVREWSQGDCVLGEHWFVFRLHVDAPRSDDPAAATGERSELGEVEVHGFMVATQTCDIVRMCSERPFVEVCPLVAVEPERLEEVRHGRRPNYAFVPGVANRGLITDLDRVMTVEKGVVASWTRTPGCRTNQERRSLASALARKRARVAFSDDFVAIASKLTRRMSSRHDKNSDEGRALRALREIRVRAAPAWDDDRILLTFWFIRNDNESRFDGRGWDHYLDAWLNLLPAGGRFTSIDGAVLTLDDLTAREFVESDPLDLDHLSV